MNRLVILSLMVFLVIACASNQPNISILYRIPEISSELPHIDNDYTKFKDNPLPNFVKTLMQSLYHTDSHLALEVGRLPEFQDIIGKNQIIALRKFVNLLENARDEEKANLHNLLQIGKSTFRKYSSPMQAIFWILEKKESESQKLLAQTLEYILNEAWDFTEQDRWDEFKVVVERLNAPELISFYSQRNFSYTRQGQRNITPRNIFYSKSGTCQDYSAFGEYCLIKGGYDAEVITVESPTGYYRNHVVVEYKGEDGKNYILDLSCIPCTDNNGIEEKTSYVNKFPQVGVGYW